MLRSGWRNGSFDEDDWEKIQDQQGIVFFRESNGRGGLEVEGLVDLVLDLGALDVATMVTFSFRVLKDAGPLFQEVDPIDTGRSGISPGKLVRTIRRLQAETQWRSHSPVRNQKADGAGDSDEPRIQGLLQSSWNRSNQRWVSKTCASRPN